MADKLIAPIKGVHESLKPYNLRGTNGDMKSGLTILSKKGIGIIYPFARNFADLTQGIETLFGYMYNMKITNIHHVSKLIFTEKVFSKKKKTYEYDGSIKVSEYLENLEDSAGITKIKTDHNTVFDTSGIFATMFPPVNHASYSDTFALNNIDEFIFRYLELLITGTVKNSLLSVTTRRWGDGILDTHDDVIIGFNVKSVNTQLSKYANPAEEVPKSIKSNFEDYGTLLIIRALVAGQIGDTEDSNLTRIYDLIADTSIVFFNNRGKSFIFNTRADQEDFKGIKFLSQIKKMFKTIIETNDHKVELDDNDELEAQYSPVKVIDNSGTDEKLTAVSKLVENKAKSKITSDDINDVDEGDDIDPDAAPKEIPLEDDEKLNDVPDDDDDDESETTSGELGDLITALDDENKPKMTAVQQRRIVATSEKYKSVMVDDKRTIEELLNDTTSETIDTIKAKPKTLPKDTSMMQSKLVDLERSYIAKGMEKDVISMVHAFSSDKSMNLHIQDFSKADTSDRSTNKFTYTFKLKDEKGKRHVINVDIPKIDNDGFMKIGGNKKILKKQFTLLPVVKYKPDRVLISSNYNKCILTRYGKIVNREVAVLERVIEKHIGSTNKKFKIFYGDNTLTNESILTTIEYDYIGSKYHRFIVDNAINGVEYIFNNADLRTLVKELKIDYKFKADRIAFGVDLKRKKVIDVGIDSGETISSHILSSINSYNVIDNLEEIVKSVPLPKRRMFSRIMVQSKDIPFIGFIGSLYGLSKIINTEKAEVEFVEKRIRGDVRSYVKFKDGILYYNDNNQGAALLLNGLVYLKSEDYTLAEFDTEKPYIDFFFNSFHTRNVHKGHTTFKDLFIDPITKDILKSLKLPLDFLELMLYSNNLLASNAFTPENDMSNWRIRGYENVSVLLYKTLATQYKLVKQNQAQTGTMKIQQDQVLTALHKSFILENYDTINPVNELKSKSTITFKGPGGVNDNRSFTLDKRSYHETAVGVVAISSVDGGNVGIVKQIVMNPNLHGTRGFVIPNSGTAEAAKKKLSQMASPEEADTAFTNTRDDPKRIGFTSGQVKHTVKVKKASPPVISTGADKTFPFFVGDTYVPKAKKDGKVLDIDMDKKIIFILNKDGTRESIKFGESVQRNSSFYFNNDIILNVKKGQQLKTGDILGYEKDFYKKTVTGDLRSSQGVLAKLAVAERDYTDDDSSVITNALAAKMATDVTKRKQIALHKDVNIISSKKVGDHVVFGDGLLTFEDAGSGGENELLEALGDVDDDILAMSRQSPKAPGTGEICEINIYITVPVDTMSDSLRLFVMRWQKEVRATVKVLRENGVDSKDEDLKLNITKPVRNRVAGVEIPEEGGVVIEYYVKHEEAMGVGDKLTFNANIKSVVAKVFEEGLEPITADGVILDGVLGEISVAARMVASIYHTGVLTHFYVETGKDIAAEYLGYK